MKTTASITVIVGALIAMPLYSGGIKKWLDADGTVTFGDVPPPGATHTETLRRHARDSQSVLSTQPEGYGTTNVDYYSPQNQLRRMQDERRQNDHQRQQRRETARQERRLRRQATNRLVATKKARMVQREKCNHYRARLGEYEHKTIQAYRSEADRLSDRSQLVRLRKLVAEYCD